MTDAELASHRPQSQHSTEGLDMKSTPDVPPALDELVTELRAIQDNFASALDLCRSGDPPAWAGDYIQDQFTAARDAIEAVARRLDEISRALRGVNRSTPPSDR